MKGLFSRDYEPVVTVDPGEPVVFSCLAAFWYWEPDAPLPKPDGAGHPLYGPIEVRGARVGETLSRTTRGSASEARESQRRRSWA